LTGCGALRSVSRAYGVSASREIGKQSYEGKGAREPMKILIAGSTGLVGTALVKALTHDGHTVCRLVRRETSSTGKKESETRGSDERVVDVAWDPEDSRGSSLADSQAKIDGADAVVNLAGASIAGGRWTTERKMILRSSRVRTTRALVTALGRLSARPKVFVSASAIGYYGSRGDEVLTEESKPGGDFLAGVSQEWEAEAVKAEALGMRVVRARFGIILAKHGGALPQMMRPFRFGVGGKIGSGQQWMSWVTLEDVVGIIRSALNNVSVNGAVNVVAPEPVRNAEFTKELARAMHRPAIFPAPAFALRLALGEMADALLLSSQRVTPSRLRQLGYRFLHQDLASGLARVLYAK
jgi:uncharacterized protein (TIGR01777 family)